MFFPCAAESNKLCNIINIEQHLHRSLDKQDVDKSPYLFVCSIFYDLNFCFILVIYKMYILYIDQIFILCLIASINYCNKYKLFYYEHT